MTATPPESTATIISAAFAPVRTAPRPSARKSSSRSSYKDIPRKQQRRMSRRYNSRFGALYMDQLSRRSFLEKLSLSAGALLAHRVRTVSAAAVQPEPRISFPTAPRERVAIASYPFRAYLASPTNRNRNPAAPGMDLTQFAAEVARKFDVHNIEPHSRHFRSLDSAYLGKFREELAKANAKVVNIAVSVEESIYDAH